MKKITINTQFITLGQFLKFSGIITNGGEAKTFIVDNNIYVNGIAEKRRGRKLFNNDIIEIKGSKYQIYYSE